ncbi:OPT-domain-containing protein, partial [Nadsonia fulvescens var. elongata DSM 6958]
MSTSEVNFSEEKTVHDDVVSSKDGELGTESNEYSEKNFNQIHSMIADGSLELPITEVDFVLSKVSVLTVEESLDILKRSVAAHKDDVNFPEKNMFLIEDLLKGPEQATTDRDTWELNLKTQAALNGFHSPYPEVRAVTDPYDDDKAPCETIRAYILGIIWVLIGTGVNQFFSPRFPSIYLTPAIFQMLLYPCGRLMQLIPDWGFTIMGTRHSFNPGPWSQKEQMFTTLMVSVSVGGAYVTLYNFIVQKSPVFYGNQWVGPGYQFLLTISTQFLGFGFAGMLRRLVIYPPKAVWPTILPTLALNRALMKPEIKENINGWTISRYYFFFIVFACSFIYFWLPNYLFGALSYFNWMTWIAPDNFNLANVTGSIIGLGINPISTFDWNVATSLLQPLAIPFFSFINQYSGQFLSAFFILGVFYSNHLWSGYLPINENSLFDNQGNTYKITSILDSKGLVDPQKYANYSPPFYSAANLVLYGAFFAIYPLSFIYIGLQEWKGICVAFKDLYLALRHPSRSQFEGQDDLHTTMMSRYPEVPDWWFYIILLMSFVLGCVCLEVYPTETPIWSLVLTIVINFVFLIPITIITAYTGFSFGLNVLVELIVGYALPGNPQALMILKAFGYNIDGQASNYISDQKMGHYAKVPPRALFRGQMIATVFQILVSIGVVNWQLGNVENFCSP